MSEYIPGRVPRSWINNTLAQLKVGETASMKRDQLAPAYQKLPGKLAREFNLSQRKIIRCLTTSDVVMFVRIE